MSKKGCFNEKCIACRKQNKYKEEYNFCPVCAMELIYVCGDSKCYNPLHNVLKKYCDSCLNYRTERKEKKKEKGLEIVKNPAGIIATATLTIAALGKLSKEVDKALLKKK